MSELRHLNPKPSKAVHLGIRFEAGLQIKNHFYRITTLDYPREYVSPEQDRK